MLLVLAEVFHMSYLEDITKKRQMDKKNMKRLRIQKCIKYRQLLLNVSVERCLEKFILALKHY